MRSYQNTSASAYELISMGESGMDSYVVHLSGSRTSPTTTPPYDLIWQHTTGTYYYPTAAYKLNVASTSANDTSNGTGARTLYIEGLDSNYDVITEAVTLAGITPVSTANSYLRVNTVFVVTTGASDAHNVGYNIGTITLTQQTSGYVVDRIEAGFGMARKLLYTVPRGYSATIMNTNVSVDKSSNCSVVYTVRRDFGTIYSFNEQKLFEQTNAILVNVGAQIPEKSDFGMYVQIISGSTGPVAASAQLLITRSLTRE